MTSALLEKLADVRDFKKILETTVKEIGEKYAADVSQIVLSNPLDSNKTSICEFAANPDWTHSQLESSTFPLHLEGGGLGLMSVARTKKLAENEANEIRLALADISSLLRYAQINDIVQRDTFRNAFMAEIVNLMNYSMGLGDALFMVVNILGKAINCSRCLFICMDESQLGWRCFEYWQRERIKSSQVYGWPTKDSAIISQSLLSAAPIISFEGQPNSYMTPIQEEMQFIGAQSLLGVAIRSEQAVHGCIIIQQCESRHAWTEDELDMVQNVADTLAEALLRLPAEKRTQEPIMRLHQREVADSKDPDKQNMQDVRRALKGALGQTAIPSARNAPVPTSTPKTAAPASAAISVPPATAPTKTDIHQPEPVGSDPAIDSLADLIASQASSENADDHAGGTSLKGLLGNILGKAPQVEHPNTTAEIQNTSASVFSQVEFDAFSNSEPSIPPHNQAEALHSSSVFNEPEDIGTAVSPDILKTELDSIPAPKTGPFGNLDAIPTPSSGRQSTTGLGTVMMGKAKASALVPQVSGLGSAFHKEKVKPAPTQFIDGPPLQIDEAEAEAKLKQLLATANPTSDYIFSLPNIDPRLLGRIDGWVSEVEQKDKYTYGHARAVAEYAAAIAHALGLTDTEVDAIRLAAVVHDVGKLGLPAQVLQKPDEELSDAELVMMMNHPIDGAKLIEAFPELQPVVPYVLSHHEEFDGNGYPEGLAGDVIPLGARIIHAANAYHSMVSDLVYRPGMPPQQAQNEMIAAAGQTYDPNVVQALLNCIAQELVPHRII